VANVEEDLEDNLLDILPLGCLETPGVPLLESIASDAGRLGLDWKRQEPLSIEAFFCPNSVLSDTLQSRRRARMPKLSLALSSSC
jgi:hypothetical protein